MASSSNGTVLNLAYCFNSTVSDFAQSCGITPVQNNGNVARITNNLNPDRTQSFTYDELNRIKTARTQATTGTHAWGLEFGYDIWANLLSASVTQGSAPMLSVGVNTKNQINNSGFVYDAAGNLTADGSLTMTYDAENRMTASAGVTYSYDGDGKRVRKSNGKLYWYGASALDAVMETDLAGNNPTEYVFFGGKRIARRDPAGAVFYYFADHLGSARIVTNSSGTIVEESDYYPFGGERVVVNNDPNPYKFTGKERDTETGLDYFVARYYSSGYGRFLSPDEFTGGPVSAYSSNDPLPPGPLPYADITNPQSLNKYTYTFNNPLNYTDPDGHCPDFWSCAKEVGQGVLQGTVNFVKNVAVGAAELIAAVDADGGRPGINTGMLIAEPIMVAVEEYSNRGISGVASAVLDQGAQGATEIVTEAVLLGGLGASGRVNTLKSPGAGGPKAAAPPGENAAAAGGRAAHAEFAGKVNAKPGWQSQPRLTDPKTGRTVRPDAVTPSGRPLELKPNTPSGRAQGQRQLGAQERATGKKGRVIYYDPEKQP